VTAMLRDGIARSASMLNLCARTPPGDGTRSSRRCCAASMRGTRPWLRTYSSAGGVSGQARGERSVLSDGSQFSGCLPARVRAQHLAHTWCDAATTWAPVSRTSSGERGTQPSGVFASASSTRSGGDGALLTGSQRLQACSSFVTARASPPCGCRAAMAARDGELLGVRRAGAGTGARNEPVYAL